MTGLTLAVSVSKRPPSTSDASGVVVGFVGDYIKAGTLDEFEAQARGEGISRTD